MANQQNIYDQETDFTFGSTIEFDNGLKLKLQNVPGQDFTQDFSSDVGFIYDPLFTEFTGGQVQQIDKRPTDATCYATYTTDINLNDGNGVLTGTSVGGAAIVGNRLDCSGGTGKYIDYDANLNGDSQQITTVKFKYIPNYTGDPGSIRGIFIICEGNNLTNNSIVMYHIATTLHWIVIDQAGAVLMDLTSAFSPTAGTPYEIEFNVNLTAGECRGFVDGILAASDLVTTGVRDANIGLLRVGSNAGGTWFPDCFIEDFIVFDTVQHTTNYVPGYTLAEYRYIGDTIILPEMEYTGAGTLISFDLFTTTEGNTPRYTLQIGRSGNYLYWDGVAWSISDGTYAQSSDYATFAANIASLPINGEIYGQFKINFDNSSTQSSVAELTASLTTQTYPDDDPSFETLVGLTTEELIAFAAIATIAGNDNIKYIIKRDDDYLYWDGAVWSTSDETYAQSNTSTEVSTNLLSLNNDDENIYFIKGFIHSDNGLTTPILTSITIDYSDGFPTIVTIIGKQYKQNGDACTTSINVQLNKSGIEYLIKNQINCLDQDIIVSSNGDWSVNLIDTDNMEGSPTPYYTFTFDADCKNAKVKKRVPKSETPLYFNQLPGI